MASMGSYLMCFPYHVAITKFILGYVIAIVRCYLHSMNSHPMHLSVLPILPFCTSKLIEYCAYPVKYHFTMVRYLQLMMLN